MAPIVPPRKRCTPECPHRCRSVEGGVLDEKGYDGGYRSCLASLTLTVPFTKPTEQSGLLAQSRDSASSTEGIVPAGTSPYNDILTLSSKLPVRTRNSRGVPDLGLITVMVRSASDVGVALRKPH